ncbi:conserved hypothetical integral membrane protein [Paenibacillus aquistagni]|uniref:Conserved hypothetical integral membrane protein n=2 Tax=Paenibacillus aquistagni TaxID=1852522 RepID=A0A1X7KVY9_9BACL|nr:DUF1146 family protein [Paenibacillus aquistagni]SMG45684.1 conserved hypothetical integral membrane protein [Paenibacillus aquistagni]
MDIDQTWNDVTQTIGLSGLMQMLITLACIALAWWSLQNVKLDLFIRHPKSAQGRMLQLLLAIIVGRAISSFFLDYWGWSQSLMHLF